MQFARFTAKIGLSNRSVKRSEERDVMSKLTGIHHAAVRCCGVDAFERTVKFYTELLGLKIDRTWGEGEGSAALIAVGNSFIEVFANGKYDDPQGAYTHLALETDDVDGMIELVRAAGYTIKVEPKYSYVGGKPPRSRLGFCIGPNGEDIEFFTRDCGEE